MFSHFHDYVMTTGNIRSHVTLKGLKEPIILRPPRGVCEAHFHLACKPYVIATIPSQTYKIVLITTNFLRFLLRMESHYEWLKIYESVGEDEL